MFIVQDNKTLEYTCAPAPSDCEDYWLCNMLNKEHGNKVLSSQTWWNVPIILQMIKFLQKICYSAHIVSTFSWILSAPNWRVCFQAMCTPRSFWARITIPLWWSRFSITIPCCLFKSAFQDTHRLIHAHCTHHIKNSQISYLCTRVFIKIS